MDETQAQRCWGQPSPARVRPLAKITAMPHPARMEQTTTTDPVLEQLTRQTSALQTIQALLSILLVLMGLGAAGLLLALFAS